MAGNEKNERRERAVAPSYGRTMSRPCVQAIFLAIACIITSPLIASQLSHLPVRPTLEYSSRVPYNVCCSIRQCIDIVSCIIPIISIPESTRLQNCHNNRRLRLHHNGKEKNIHTLHPHFHRNHILIHSYAYGCWIHIRIPVHNYFLSPEGRKDCIDSRTSALRHRCHQHRRLDARLH